MHNVTIWLRKHQVRMACLYRNRPFHAWGIFSLITGYAVWSWITVIFPRFWSDEPGTWIMSLLIAVLYTVFSLVLLHTRINRLEILMAEFRREMLADRDRPVRPNVMELFKLMADIRGIRVSFDAFLANYDQAFPPTTEVVYTALLNLAGDVRSDNRDEPASNQRC
ncbi:hypothetical protein [Serratia fonticola]|uniref:hypothetical protein n=1 Tax=Serratia fonticola TaxID=47917 RepID=UPI000E0F3712|nr:hypothetical protein [Serratia fonticola]RDL15597.1 hypothetical protein DFO62_1237 [Serratia fonticola]